MWVAVRSREVLSYGRGGLFLIFVVLFMVVV